MTEILNFTGKTVLISAGGTGGHVYPALAVAKRLRELGATIVWLGTDAGIEARLVPEADIPLHTIFVQGLRGNGWKRFLKAPLTLSSAVMQARRIIKEAQPDIYLGFGGFASGPGALASRLCAVPVVIHEQNAAMGATNKIVSLWAKRVLLAFPIQGQKGEVVGNPIRDAILNLAPPKARIRGEKPFRVLVVGGSLGAKAINEVVPEALAPLLGDIVLTHQTGKTTYMETVAAYAKHAITEHVTLCEYIDDIESVYADTDIVIARAGASTVSEIATIGLPTIFIPLPHATDNHQFHNAQFLAENEGAIILLQDNLTPERLRHAVSDLLDKEKLIAMAENARQLSHANALEQLTQALAEVIYANDAN